MFSRSKVVVKVCAPANLVCIYFTLGTRVRHENYKRDDIHNVEYIDSNVYS